METDKSAASTGRVVTKSEADQANQSDAFLQTMQTGVSFVEKHKGLIVTTLVALLVIGLGYAAYDVLAARSAKNAADDFFKVEAEYLKLREGFDRAKYEALSPLPQKDPSKPESKAATGDLDKDYGKVVADLETFLSQNSSSSAGAQAALILGDLYSEYKQPDKALAALDKVAPHLGRNDLLYGLVHMLRGTVLATKDDCAQAITNWQKVVDSTANEFLHPDALLKSGVCHEKLQQNDTAATVYKRITDQHADSGAAQSAKSFLRALQMRKATAGVPPAAG